MLIERLLSAGTIPQDTVVTIDDRPAFRTLQAVRHPDDPVQEGTGIGLGAVSIAMAAAVWVTIKKTFE